ncbi:hypothetical protein LTR35_018150 [Friedmanniomyces endolithicus]|nr:hypothetical protein LTR35_018150 [Friedmanniomyces endolithicus]KAK0267066.1 hypothetical protein LTS00_017878 [Friedmanniomyces endolithicus]
MCDRAVVPRLHVFSWRQFIVAIVKTKFASDAICFDPEDFNGDGEEIEADNKVAALARSLESEIVSANKKRKYSSLEEASIAKSSASGSLRPRFTLVDIGLVD